MLNWHLNKTGAAKRAKRDRNLRRTDKRSPSHSPTVQFPPCPVTKVSPFVEQVDSIWSEHSLILGQVKRID